MFEVEYLSNGWVKKDVVKANLVQYNLRNLKYPYWFCFQTSFKFKSNFLLFSLYYAKACNEFVGPISASLSPGNTASFEEISQRWRTVGNTLRKI